MPDLDRLRDAVMRPGGDSSDFDLNPAAGFSEGRVEQGRALKPAAVLVALWGDQIVFTKRASHLLHHPGQISFPGGKVEPCDKTAAFAALREASEEIGLDPASVEVLGHLAPHETVTGFLIEPILAAITGPFLPKPDPSEVDEVFAVPLAHLLNTENYRIEQRQWKGEWRRFYAIPFGPYYIWGATARILRGLADRATL
jgi:8-oxo-dGTP pyrophosphatase MutT (NUDIX family)